MEARVSRHSGSSTFVLSQYCPTGQGLAGQKSKSTGSTGSTVTVTGSTVTVTVGVAAVGTVTTSQS